MTNPINNQFYNAALVQALPLDIELLPSGDQRSLDSVLSSTDEAVNETFENFKARREKTLKRKKTLRGRLKKIGVASFPLSILGVTCYKAAEAAANFKTGGSQELHRLAKILNPQADTVLDLKESLKALDLEINTRLDAEARNNKSYYFLLEKEQSLENGIRELSKTEPEKVQNLINASSVCAKNKKLIKLRLSAEAIKAPSSELQEIIIRRNNLLRKLTTAQELLQKTDNQINKILNHLKYFTSINSTLTTKGIEHTKNEIEMCRQAIQQGVKSPKAEKIKIAKLLPLDIRTNREDITLFGRNLELELSKINKLEEKFLDFNHQVSIKKLEEVAKDCFDQVDKELSKSAEIIAKTVELTKQRINLPTENLVEIVATSIAKIELAKNFVEEREIVATSMGGVGAAPPELVEIIFSMMQ